MRRRTRTPLHAPHPFAASQAGLYTQVSLLLTRLGQSGVELDMRSNYAEVIPGRKFEADVAIPELKIGCEYQGGDFMTTRSGHTKVGGLLRDRIKLNEAQLNGWLWLQFGADDTRSGEAMNVVERAVMLRLREMKLCAE